MRNGREERGGSLSKKILYGHTSTFQHMLCRQVEESKIPLVHVCLYLQNCPPVVNGQRRVKWLRARASITSRDPEIVVTQYA